MGVWLWNAYFGWLLAHLHHVIFNISSGRYVTVVIAMACCWHICNSFFSCFWIDINLGLKHLTDCVNIFNSHIWLFWWHIFYGYVVIVCFWTQFLFLLLCFVMSCFWRGLALFCHSCGMLHHSCKLIVVFLHLYHVISFFFLFFLYFTSLVVAKAMQSFAA